jgi:predicted MFS family arabinose efflux permease
MRPALAGTAAVLTGIGLARFAYVPLFPAMVSAGWVSGAEAGLLGAMNLAGYVLGTMGGRTLGRRIGTARALDAGMALAIVASAGCAWDLGVAWLALCRLMTGLAGGILMALAGPAVQGAVAPERRGAAGGIVITGVGVGILVASLAVPAFLHAGVAATWLGLAGLMLLLWAWAHQRWPTTPVQIAPLGEAPVRAIGLLAAYGLAGAGMVPHMVFFVDFAVRGRGFDPWAGSALWLVFGAGGIAGTLLGGRAADRWSARTALLIWYVALTVALAAALTALPGALVVSAFLGGFGSLGLTAVALARARELAGPQAGALWVAATTAFAVAQAGTAFAMTALFGRTGSYELLFGVALALSLAALAIGLVEPRSRNRISTRAGPAGRTGA